MESVTTAYRPSKAVTDFVTTRDGTCRMWGCNRPATTCDLDHARPWPTGPTTPTNLAGLCRRHHRLKQRRRWSYHLAPDGTATWTSPNRHASASRCPTTPCSHHHRRSRRTRSPQGNPNESSWPSQPPPF